MKHYLVCKVTAEEVEIFLDGKRHVVPREWENADKIIELATEYNTTTSVDDRKDLYKQIKKAVSPKLRQMIEDSGYFSQDAAGNLYFKDLPNEPLSTFLTTKVKDALENNLPLMPLINFLTNLALNPKKEVRNELYTFLEHNGHPLTEKGYFLAYKAVNVKRKFNKDTGDQVIEYDEDTGKPVDSTFTTSLTFTSIHQGPYGDTIKVGEPVKMPRNKCDDDRTRTCSEGLHVGSMEYVRDFGYGNSPILEVLVNPMNVVSVPGDYNNTKMRVCEYFPYALSNGENNQIFLESDYDAFSSDARAELLQKAQKATEKQIEDLEEQLELLKSQKENNLL